MHPIRFSNTCKIRSNKDIDMDNDHCYHWNYWKSRHLLIYILTQYLSRKYLKYILIHNINIDIHK